MCRKFVFRSLAYWYRVGLDQRSGSTSGPVSTGMGDSSRVRVAFGSILVFNQPNKLTQPGRPSG